jgi:hypothetical protein
MTNPIPPTGRIGAAAIATALPAVAMILAAFLPAAALGGSAMPDASQSACAKDWGSDMYMREKCEEQETVVSRIIETYEFKMPEEWVREVRRICGEEWKDNPRMIYYCMIVQQRIALRSRDTRQISRGRAP